MQPFLRRLLGMLRGLARRQPESRRQPAGPKQPENRTPAEAGIDGPPISRPHEGSLSEHFRSEIARPEANHEVGRLEEFDELLSSPRQPDRSAMAPKDEEIDAAYAAAVELAHDHPGLVADDMTATLEAMIGHLDRTLSDQLSEIYHDRQFQALESAWRGLHYLVARCWSGTVLKVRMLNACRAELTAAVGTGQGDSWRHSPISRKLYDDIYDKAGAAPYAVLVVDDYFDHRDVDVAFLRAMARICARCQTVLLAGASPRLFGGEGFDRLAGGGIVRAIFAADEYVAWNAMRRAETSRYVGLCLPRLLARPPFGNRTNPVEDFAFEERPTQHRKADHAWMNSAYAMAANIARSVEAFGWPVRIRGVSSGGQIDGVPSYSVESDGAATRSIGPAESALNDRREHELARCGLISVVSRGSAGKAAFIGAQSLNAPQTVEGSDGDQQTAMKALLARLPHLLFLCRYGHYVMRMFADRRAARPDSDLDSFESYMRRWFDNFVSPTPWQLHPSERGRRPLASASFRTAGTNDNAAATLELVPGYLLEGMGFPFRLDVELPR